MAAQKEKPGQTLQGTALVHEACRRVLDVDKAREPVTGAPRKFSRFSGPVWLRFTHW
jgi:hypothetical protein